MPRQRTVDATLAPYEDQLGKVPDHQIAAQAGVSRAAVVNHRKRLGIPAYEGYKFTPQGEGAAPRRAPTKAMAKTKAPDAPRRKPGRPPKVKPVASTDGAPAAPAIGAPAKEKATGRVRAFRGRRSALDPYAHLLGTLPDREIAEMAGVSAENVRAYRVRRGIRGAGATAATADAPTPAPLPTAPAGRPAKGVRTQPPTAAEARSPAPDRAGDRTAYSIGWAKDGRSGAYVVVASDMRGAAEGAERALAARHPGAMLVSIQRVAEILA
jgi:hypothetical protein